MARRWQLKGAACRIGVDKSLAQPTLSLITHPSFAIVYLSGIHQPDKQTEKMIVIQARHSQRRAQQKQFFFVTADDASVALLPCLEETLPCGPLLILIILSVLTFAPWARS
jgi:hypothetical protein